MLVIFNKDSIMNDQLKQKYVTVFISDVMVFHIDQTSEVFETLEVYYH